jgi:membrane-associated phospholipid phosphatase
MPSWTTLTDFGDSALLVPSAILILLWLTLQRAWRPALSWGLAFVAAALLVAASKIAYLGWGVGVPSLTFRGASGHAMLATSVFGTLGVLVGHGRPVRLRAAAWMASFGLAAAVGLSRVVLQAHSPSEVVAGCALGAGVVLIATRSFGPATVPLATPAGPQRRRGVLMLGVLSLALLLHGQRAPSQALIEALALQLSGHDRLYAPAA